MSGAHSSADSIAVLARIDPELHQQLKDLACRNERSMAAEMRLALRDHVAVDARDRLAQSAALEHTA